jgi:hypothetical protein
MDFCGLDRIISPLRHIYTIFVKKEFEKNPNSAVFLPDEIATAEDGSGIEFRDANWFLILKSSRNL